jgi:hypothetical protein
MQRDEMELLAVRATLWRMEIEILREIHRYRFAKRGRRFGSDVELMIVYGAARDLHCIRAARRLRRLTLTGGSHSHPCRPAKPAF